MPSAHEPVSVIVPSRGEGARLLRCIDQLSRLDGAGEVIVAACDESSATRRRALGCPHLRWIDCQRPSRAAQLAAGAKVARHPILLFLHADTELPPGAWREIGSVLRDPRVVGGAFRIAFDARHPALRLLEALSALPWRCAYLGDQAMFCRRDAYVAAGGFPSVPLLEDVALARGLGRRGRLVRLRPAVRTSARRFLARGPWRQLALNALLLGLHAAGLPPRRLARAYRP